MNPVVQFWKKLNLVQRIVIGLVVGIILAVTLGDKISVIAIFGNLFMGALRGIAPILVFVLVIASLCKQQTGRKTNMKDLIILYIIGTFIAAFSAAAVSFIFPIEIKLNIPPEVRETPPPQNVGEVLLALLMNIVDNPIKALVNANYLGILAWALVFGIFLKNIASDTTKEVIGNISDAVMHAVRLVISLAPLGIMGLVYTSIMESGPEILVDYGMLVLALVSTMLFVALIINPLIVFVTMRQNPFPLVFRSLRESGITAFFTRSSAANIPVNLRLCENMGLNKDMYSIAVPLGANINMQGAAVTITMMVLTAVHSLGISIDFPTAVLLCFAAALGATGASGVPGGSLLLIPLGAGMVGISQDIAMQVVAVGFIISVIQDSCETALNSSTDPVLIGAVEQRRRKKEGLPLLDFSSKKD